MTPKEKAKELYKDFNEHAKYWDCYNDSPLEKDHALRASLLCVDEILSATQTVNKMRKYPYVPMKDFTKYWEQVKFELKKLNKHATK